MRAHTRTRLKVKNKNKKKKKKEKKTPKITQQTRYLSWWMLIPILVLEELRRIGLSRLSVAEEANIKS